MADTDLILPYKKTLSPPKDAEGTRTYTDEQLGRIANTLKTIREVAATLEARILVSEGDITTIEGDITTIEGDITTIEGDITTIEGDITTIEGDISTLQNDVGDCIVDPGAWASWTPTITPNSGTFTSASAAGRYAQYGKLVVFRLSLTITTVGTADAVAVDLSTPVTALASAGPVFMGRDNVSTGDWFIARLASTTAFRIQGDATGAGHYPNTAGARLDFSGVYEAA